MRVVCIALLAACGRIAFDPNAGSDGGDGAVDPGDGASLDALPPGFCSASTPVGSDSTGDLTAAQTRDGFLAIWGTSSVPRMVHASATFAFDPPAELAVLGSALEMNALFDESTVYLVATGDAAAKPSWWSLNANFTQQSVASGAGTQPLAKDNIVSNAAKSSFVYVDGNGTTIGTRYFFGNGFGATATSFTAAASIVAVAGADGPDHAHVAWTTAPNATTRTCYWGHIQFNANPVIMNVTQAVATGCGSQLRAASGAATDDALAIAWTDGVGSVHARYKAQQWDLGAGNGVRIKFDGTQFWVAWRSQTDGVHLAKLVAGGTFVDFPLPALAPISLEALELVAAGSMIYVVSLEPTRLVYVWPC